MKICTAGSKFSFFEAGNLRVFAVVLEYLKVFMSILKYLWVFEGIKGCFKLSMVQDGPLWIIPGSYISIG